MKIGFEEKLYTISPNCFGLAFSAYRKVNLSMKLKSWKINRESFPHLIVFYILIMTFRSIVASFLKRSTLLWVCLRISPSPKSSSFFCIFKKCDLHTFRLLQGWKISHFFISQKLITKASTPVLVCNISPPRDFTCSSLLKGHGEGPVFCNCFMLTKGHRPSYSRKWNCMLIYYWSGSDNGLVGFRVAWNFT